MLRSFFLYLSAAKWARRFLMALPFAGRFSRRFVAGETIDDAIAVARALNQKNILVTLDHLGENVFTEADANRSTQAYLDLLDRIAEAGVKANCSLKPTQLGLDVSEDLCLANIRRVVEKAKGYGNFIRIDMEGSPYTDKTLTIFRKLRKEYDLKNVGVVIQAYLFRSEADVRALAAEGANIRLCKGAYKEPPEIAFPLKADVDKNYVKLMQIYLDEPARAAGAYIGVATHDEAMLQATKEYTTAKQIDKGSFEFQMLYGIRPQEHVALAAAGYKMRVYVPYGTEWYPYFMRRLAERPANVWFILRHLFS